MFNWSFSTFALMENKRFWRFLLFGQVFFALALLVFVAFQWKSKQETTISVHASLCAHAPVDLGIWSGEITVRKNDLFAAQDELERNRERVFRNFTAKGMAAEDIEFLPIQTQSDSLGTVLTQVVELRSADLTRLKKVAAESSELLKFQVDFSSEQPRYHIANFTTWLVEQLPKLIESAKLQAAALSGEDRKIVSMKHFKLQPVSSMEYASCFDLSPSADTRIVLVFLVLEVTFVVR